MYTTVTWVCSRLQLKCDGTRWRKGGEVKGKLENGVGSHFTHDVSSITTAEAHTSAASSPLNLGPRRCKWTRPFRRKTKSGFCACVITFQLASTRININRLNYLATIWNGQPCRNTFRFKYVFIPFNLVFSSLICKHSNRILSRVLLRYLVYRDLICSMLFWQL